MSDNRGKNDEDLLNKLDVIGHGGWFLWKIFLLCMIPSILNGLNLTSYVYLAEVPQYWCSVPELSKANWTDEEIRLVSSPKNSNESSCLYYSWNYEDLASMTFEDAWNYVRNHDKPTTQPCTAYSYPERANSMVVNYDLVCERTALKSIIQVALSLGKFLGAFLFGIISDRYGRRVSFFLGCILYIISGPLVAFAFDYAMLIVGRIGLGAAASGIYHSAFVILSEIANKKRRASLGIIYNMSYPIGQMIVPLIAFFVRDWRLLQLSISVPAILTLLFYWFLPESPRWLISKGRTAEAAVFIEKVYTDKMKNRKAAGKTELRGGREVAAIVEDGTTKNPVKISPSQDRSQEPDNVGNLDTSPIHGNTTSRLQSIWLKLSSTLSQLFQLVKYSELRNRLFIMLFCWCICSLSYYALALNVDNFNVDRYLYGFLTGLVEVPSYILPLPFLRCLGRRHTAIILFYIGGIALISILGIPRTDDNSLLLLIVASVGRLCASGVFAVVILHTTELFPTLLRNTAIGAGSTSAHIGSMSAPFIVDLLGAYAWFIPSTVCGIATLLAGTLIFLLPETKNKPLPDTTEQILSSSKPDKTGFHQICR